MTGRTIFIRRLTGAAADVTRRAAQFEYAL